MEFYLNIDGNQSGPLDIAEFRELVKNKAVSQEDYVWEAKQGRWIKIKFYAELAGVFDEEATLAAAEDEGFFINVEGKTGGPFPRDAIIKEIERGRFKGTHFVWDAVANRWLKAAEHPVFSQFLDEGFKPATAQKYYLSKEGARFGPFEYPEVEEKIKAGEFTAEHFLWEAQLKKWVKISDVADFAEIFAELAGAEPEVPPPMPGAPAAETPAPPGTGPAAAAAGLSLPLDATPTDAPPGPAATPEPPAPGPAGPPVGMQPLGPAASPPGPSASTEPEVGDLVSIPIPPPGEGAAGPPTPTETAPPAPGGPPAPSPAEAAVTAPIKRPAAPESPKKVSVDEVEFRKVAEEEAKEERSAVEPREEEDDVKVDRSVVLDFSRPSLLRRVAAQLVDVFVISLSYFLVALIFSFLEMNPYMPGPDQYYFQQLFWGTVAGISAFYFLIRDAGGASLGKRIMGLRVVKFTDYGQKANLFHSIMRNITLLVPLLNILDVVYAVTDPKGRRVGDRLAGTVLTESTELDYMRQQRTILDEIY
ncbi:MAG: RDD family protein [Candidatus Zixiibacteriota bacterium]|jgi:uncharacterized RDD family membrane protein YckC